MEDYNKKVFIPYKQHPLQVRKCLWNSGIVLSFL